MSSLQTLLLTAIDYVVSNRPQKNGNTPQINTTKCFHEVAIWVILITKIYFGGFFVHERKKKAKYAKHIQKPKKVMVRTNKLSFLPFN